MTHKNKPTPSQRREMVKMLVQFLDKRLADESVVNMSDEYKRGYEVGFAEMADLFLLSWSGVKKRKKVAK